MSRFLSEIEPITGQTSTLNLLIFSNFSSFADTFYYSGGCFWCTEADAEKLNGVKDVISGFTAGTTKNPKYIPGQWGDHREAALVEYNPKIISFKFFAKMYMWQFFYVS